MPFTPERWRQIEGLFERAVELPPPERASYLEQACGDDHALRREVDSLLACDEPELMLAEIPTGFRVTPPGDADAAPDIAGGRLGPYRVSRLLGRGGMGAVYLASRDDDQYQKEVALKLLNRGMDTDFMLTRFRQERQILANMEHPFIARLLDGGATADGLPYLVMEYVKGSPVTAYCQEQQLSIPERLRLFRLVCEAVQYAHQNLVIHRDIKPSNILATNEGIPKLLDFGIAKVLDPRAAGDVTSTRRELRLFTPGYASPEQVRGLPVSTASDIYSLGAVLYELLSGQSPHRFTSDSATEMERVICDVDPEKPSAVAPKAVRKLLAGDLDNIVLTAMRKEPQRRYASAAELSEDLSRHLEALPVRARESSWLYRTGKFVRRHKAGVLAAALVVASLVGGIVATRIQAQRAERRFQLVRGLANNMLFDLHDRMERLPGSMELRAATIGTVVKYLDSLARDGSQDPGLDIEIAKAYERAGNLEGHPMRSNLGRSPAARAHYRKALAIYERLAARPELGSEVVRGLIETHLKVAGMETFLGNPTVAAVHWGKASAIANEAFARGDPEIPRGTQVQIYFRLADAEYDRGLAQSEADYYAKAAELCERWTADTRTPEAMSYLRDSLRNLGSALARKGDPFGGRERLRQAERIAEELLRRPDATVEQQYNAIGVYTSHGDVLAAPDDANLGDRAGALVLYRKALAMAERLAASEPGNANARRYVASCHQRLGMQWAEEKPAVALEHFRQALSMAEGLGASDPLNNEYRYHASRALAGMGEALHHLGRHEEALQSLDRSLAIQEAIAAVSPERIWNLRVSSRTQTMRGRVLLAHGDPEAALAALTEALAVADRMLRRGPTSLYHQLDRADVLEALGAHHAWRARRPGAPRAAGERARSYYQMSLALWQDWAQRKLSVPYATWRTHRINDALASLARQ